ncbi:hypothetical protein CJ030_MR6G013307 [Morella rubra]|uniref:Uncharacterized protein n=1 Tax=Morella rubra TaxID=262757 RepID=A0A6A1VG70_9ROSI|nr:hypothetical protein CJ030_MR6G013307 [Morella rubra]
MSPIQVRSSNAVIELPEKPQERVDDFNNHHGKPDNPTKITKGVASDQVSDAEVRLQEVFLRMELSICLMRGIPRFLYLYRHRSSVRRLPHKVVEFH